MKTKTYYLFALITLSMAFAIYEGLLYWHDLDAANNLLLLWQLLFAVLLVIWVEADSKEQSKIYRPYDFGFLVFLFWVPYLPYYLWRTRGPRGIAMLGGFVALFYLGSIVQWCIYFLR